MIRVISSPSISTIGFVTLIFAILVPFPVDWITYVAGRVGHKGVYARLTTGYRRACREIAMCSESCKRAVPTRTRVHYAPTIPHAVSFGPHPPTRGHGALTPEFVAASRHARLCPPYPKWPSSASERGERGVQRGARPHRGRCLGEI